MITAKEAWYESKGSKLSVKSLRLWGENPRLDPTSKYVKNIDFANEICGIDSERKSFMSLIKSISEKGYISIEPIIVWKNPSNNRFYVAEGNRRVLAMKLLLTPSQSPVSIKATVHRLSKSANIDELKKIRVLVAPTLEETKWYIYQRHSLSASLQKRWTREQQYQAIINDFYANGEDFDKIKSITTLSESEIHKIIRAITIKSHICSIEGAFTKDEITDLQSHRFPLSTLERFIENSAIRDRLGLCFDKNEVIFTGGYNETNTELAKIAKMILIGRNGSEGFHSRTPPEKVLDHIKAVAKSETPQRLKPSNKNKPNQTITEPEKTRKPKKTRTTPTIIPKHLVLTTDNKRLIKIFDELQRMSCRSYPNATGALFRVFLDLSILEYIEAESLEESIISHFNDNNSKNRTMKHINLKQRIDFIKKNSKLPKDIKTRLGRLTQEEKVYSLDVLNGYVHSKEPLLTEELLHQFWSQLYPFFKAALSITEQNK